MHIMIELCGTALPIRSTFLKAYPFTTKTSFTTFLTRPELEAIAIALPVITHPQAVGPDHFGASEERSSSDGQ